MDFDVFFNDNYWQACRFARGIVGSADAEDIVQDAFARLYMNRHQLDGLENTQAWFFRILHNICLNVIRRRGIWNRIKGFIGMSSVPTPPGETAHLQGAWSMLTPTEKAIFFLMDYQGWESAAAARALSMSESTLRVHRHHTRRKITEWEERP